jgi:hypothetical protein
MGGGLMQLVAIHRKVMELTEAQERHELRQSFEKPEDMRAFVQKNIGYDEDKPAVYLTMALRRADALKGHYNLAYIVGSRLPDEDFLFGTKPNGSKCPQIRHLKPVALADINKPYGKMMEALMEVPLSLKSGHSLLLDTKDEQKLYCDVPVGGKRYLWLSRAGENAVGYARNGSVKIIW